MKRSKATFYRNVKRGTTTCLELSQENCDNSKHDCINNNVSKNIEDFQYSSSETDCFNKSDCFNISHDLYSQSSDNSDNVIEIDIPISQQNVENQNVHQSNSFSSGLRSWAISNNITHNALRSLLNLLKLETNISLPQDPRTLLCTPRHIPNKSVGSGAYVHMGIQFAVENLINLLEKQPEKIKLLINIDGLPLSKSSSS